MNGHFSLLGGLTVHLICWPIASLAPCFMRLSHLQDFDSFDDVLALYKCGYPIRVPVALLAVAQAGLVVVGQ